MKRLIAILLLAFCAAPAQAGAYVERAGVRLDPNGVVRPDLLARALTALAAATQARRDIVAIVDFAQPSTRARFYIVDLTTGAVAAYRTAHGKGSDIRARGFAETFSNKPNSKASSRGAYLTGRRYFGGHGLALELDGLAPTNSQARARAIVLHSAPYMEERFIAAHGRPGRSWGCFVLDPQVIETVVGRLENGALIFADR